MYFLKQEGMLRVEAAINELKGDHFLRKYITKIGEYIDRTSEFWGGENKTVCNIFDDMETSTIDMEIENLHLKDRLNSSVVLIKNLIPHIRHDKDLEKIEEYLKNVGDPYDLNLSEERKFELFASSDKNIVCLDLENELVKKYASINKQLEVQHLENLKLREEISKLKDFSSYKKAC